MRTIPQTPRRAHILFFLCAGLLLFGCQPTPEKDNTPGRTDTTPVAKTPTPSPPEEAKPPPMTPSSVARAGALVVTLEDYENTLAKHRLRGQTPSPQTLADPRFQHQVIQQSLVHILMGEEASRRTLNTSPKAQQQQLAKDPTLSPLKGIHGDALTMILTDRFDATPHQLSEQLIEYLWIEQLTTILLSETLTKEHLWNLYKAEKERVTVDIFWRLNVPSTKEISNFIQNNEAQIQTLFDKNSQRYQNPETASVWKFSVAIPPDATLQDIQVLRQEALDFRRKALHSNLKELASKHSADLLTKGSGGRLPPVTRAQMPQAFEAEIGAFSDILRDRHSFFFWRVEQRTPPQTRTLDPGLKREIASEILKTKGASPSAKSALNTLRLILASTPKTASNPGSNPGSKSPADLEKLAKSQGAHFIGAVELNRSGKRRVPKLGRLKAVEAAAFALTSSAPISAKPFLEGNRLFLLKLKTSSSASKTRFVAAETKFRQEREEALAPKILRQHLQKQLPKEVQVNLRLVQKKYGLLQRDGSIQYPEPPTPTH